MPRIIFIVSISLIIYISFDEFPRANSSKWWSAQSNVNPPYVPLDERGFRRALDQFSGADMRMGK
ncbi:hypothetical protein PHLCEN_2v502 [Hermanssonia centrifuga]|uniref:Uncharacterized protein n=1 Tax=Hermanssonia centrifuga TaxID=98765 RepID=A0A2R6S5X1_9APHY|nr:hypothetical protein PHLCEN_2v502 [Hermanssonia centrifuga]